MKYKKVYRWYEDNELFYYNAQIEMAIMENRVEDKKMWEQRKEKHLKEKLG